MAEKVRIVIDDREYEVEKGKTVLQVALENGIDIPYFCYHPRLSIAGACRMCVVYWENINRLVISCNTPVQEGMIIRTHKTSKLVEENQKYLLQALMTRHPLDCPICDKAGECDLQNYGAIYGPQRQVVPISALEKEREEHDWESEFLEYYSNRCVVCYRCTRACDEVVGAHALYVEERGFHSNIVPTVRPMDTSTCEMCGICVHVCPVGAIISKPFKFWSRSWLLERGLTRCNLCPAGCEVQVEYGLGDWRAKRKVYRTKPTEDLNICAKAFFGYDALNTDRLLKPQAQGREESEGNVLNLLRSMLTEGTNSTAFILSGYLSCEVIDSVVAIAKKVGAYLTAPQTETFFRIAEGTGYSSHPSLEELQKAEFTLIVGDDLTSTAPVLSYYINGKVYHTGEFGRDEKLNPEKVSLDKALKLKGKGAVLVNCASFEPSQVDDLVKTLKGLVKKGHTLFLVPRESNTLYLYLALKDLYSDLGEVLNLIQKGQINTAFVFGEDIVDYGGMEALEPLSGASNLIVSSPFEEGISLSASVKVPMSLFGESEGSYETFMGRVKGRKVLPWSFDDTVFWSHLMEAVSGNGEVQRIRGDRRVLRKPEIHIYGGSWILRRSENLNRLYEKNLQSAGQGV